MPVLPFPPGFQVQEVPTKGASIHVQVGGHGPAVVMLHGFGDTGDMWAPVTRCWPRSHGRRSRPAGHGPLPHPDGGYDKKTQAGDIARSLDELEVGRADLVTHDIGNMVGYALRRALSRRVTRWVAMDAPLPGIGMGRIIKARVWHFNFRGPDVERLVQGRERIYLDRFWDELSANPKAIDEATREHYAALYARPGAMHCAFDQFAAFCRTPSTTKPSAQRQADDAGTGDRRRAFIWHSMAESCGSSRPNVTPV